MIIKKIEIHIFTFRFWFRYFFMSVDGVYMINEWPLVSGFNFSIEDIHSAHLLCLFLYANVANLQHSHGIIERNEYGLSTNRQLGFDVFRYNQSEPFEKYFLYIYIIYTVYTGCILTIYIRNWRVTGLFWDFWGSLRH